ncbi:hypothetical protein QJS10_CPA02g00618 [Acorus calamus]|uniref:Peptidase S1 domain-containing protein n=1 Tax=Acorus calamus TaxID=4465 RepID=A0AAV9FEP0_ACOCL|nr:hypothetical protein QJS10_CPA02g00618 [Acorus calamus]
MAMAYMSISLHSSLLQSSSSPSLSFFRSSAPRSRLSCSASPSSRNRAVKRGSHSSCKLKPSTEEVEVTVVSHKRSPGRRKEERVDSFQDDAKGQTGYNNFQGNDAGNLQNAAFLNAVVKVYCTHTAPDYSLPWQKQRQYTSTGRHVLINMKFCAFMIGDGKLLTNAHCVEHGTQGKTESLKAFKFTLKVFNMVSGVQVNYQRRAVFGINMVDSEMVVKVKRRGDDTKFVAKVLARGIECDIALLSVDNDEFWKGAEPLRFGHLPSLQDAVTVVGYPLGGDTISVTKGVVSRIEVTSYAHGTSDLLGIQIDAAINPGNSGGPAFNEHGECIGVAFQVYRSDDAENIGYVIPTTVVSHFLDDFERMENIQGVLVRTVEPTAPASEVLKEGSEL